METVKSYDHNSELQRQARFKTLQITSNREKGIIKVNGGGTIIIINDTSIYSCEVEGNGQLVINTNDGRKIIFKAESKSETIKLLARLNRALAGSNCELRFELPIQRNPLSPSLETTENNQSQQKNSLGSSVVVSALLISVFAGFIFITSRTEDRTKVDTTDSKPVVEDAWEARLKRDREEWDKKQETERVERQSKTSNSVSSTNSEDSKRTKISAIILSVACAAKTGFIPRSQMGINIKKMLSEGGYDPTDVYGNWDYYWERAQEIDKVAKSFCIT
jgi:hypothetical protein